MDTFVIRVYSDAGAEWPGRVEHVGSGGVRLFHSLAELGNVVTDLLESAEGEPATAHPSAARQTGTPPHGS